MIANMPIRRGGVRLELIVEQEHKAGQENCDAEDDRAPSVIVEAEDDGAVARIAGRDVEENLSTRKDGARGGGKQDQAVVPRCEAEPQIKDQTRRHASERYALEETERAGQLIAGKLQDEGRQQKRRHEVQRDDVEEDDYVGGHDATRCFVGMGGVRHGQSEIESVFVAWWRKTATDNARVSRKMLSATRGQRTRAAIIASP